ncbi:MAG: hypothetical protein QM589_07515 [Thermomicrobiales bacterium]
MAQTTPPGTRIPESPPTDSDTSLRRRRTGLRSPRLHAIISVLAAAVLALGIMKQASTWAQDSGTPAGSPAASPTVAITPAPDAPRLTLPFEILNDSGLSGTATLYEAGDKTIVDLDVKNTGDDQPAHIHSGTCGNLEPEPAFDLTPLHADGKSRTVIDTPLDGLLNGQFAIDIHLSPTELGTLSACANIEGTPSVPNGTATPETGSPTATVTPIPTGQGGDVTTPTATATTASVSTVAPTTAATTSAQATTPTTVVTTPTATTAASGTTNTNGGHGDGTGGSTSGTTSTTSTSSTGDGTTGTTSSTANTSSASTSASTTNAGDGTGVGGETASGSTYIATNGTVQTASMAASGTGPLGIVPEGIDPAIVWSVVSAAIVLFTAGIWIWIGERRSSHRQPPRWSRLGM